jgi:hypothetical protein
MNLTSSPGSPPECEAVARSAVDEFWDNFYPDLLRCARRCIAKHDWYGLARPDVEDIAQGAALRLFSGKTTKHWKGNIAEMEDPESIRKEIATELWRLARLEVDLRRPGRRIENAKQVALLNNHHYDAIKTTHPEQLAKTVSADNAAQNCLEGMPETHPSGAIDYQIILKEVSKVADPESQRLLSEMLNSSVDGTSWTELGKKLGIDNIFKTKRHLKTQFRKWYASNQ